MNYGEELVYWYLRLNGFFPLRDFVIHRSKKIEYTSDCDLLAVRAPYVFEEIGGQPDDWDADLADSLAFGALPSGLICEVKTGRYDLKDLFPPQNVEYSLGRLGIVPPDEVAAIVAVLDDEDCVGTERYRVAKLLVTNDDDVDGPFIFRSLTAVEDFILGRINRYPKEKFADRMFFPSELFQYLIDKVNRERLAKAKQARH